jgi:hypothetical protein
MEVEGSLPSSKQYTTGPYPLLNEFGPHIYPYISFI